MTDRVLYFPYINIPKTSWTIRALLYWDQLGSIVPHEYLDRPEKFDAQMLELVRTGLVKQIVPGMHLHKVNRFGAEFMNMVLNAPDVEDRRLAFLHGRRVVRIHMEKLHNVADMLVAEGLARPSTRARSWYSVETTTSRLFMAYLASVLGHLDEVNMMPITDRPASFGAYAGEARRLEVPDNLQNQIRVTLLREILPAPMAPISTAELIKFKERHGVLLQRFRASIEQRVADLAAVTNAEIRAERIRQVVDNAQERIEEIQARMEERGWKNVVCGTLCSLMCAGCGAVDAFGPDARPIAGVGALAGLINAIYGVFQERADRKAIARSPLAYAAVFRAQVARLQLVDPGAWV